MSKVAAELEKLKEERTEVEKDILAFTTAIINLKKTEAEYQEKLNVLGTKTSELAAKITAKTQRDLNAIKEAISEKETIKNKKEAYSREIEKKISEREDDTTLYIQEQCNLMVEEFMKYIKRNAEEIGNQIKKTFVIKSVSIKIDDRYGPYYTPTGNVGIYNKSDEHLYITKSEGFYFENILCTCERGEYDNITCSCTEWYKEYLKKFSSIFLKTLEEKFDSRDFKLSINKPHKTFTLELV